MKVWLDESAIKVLSALKKKGEPYVTIVEDGCCGFSGVFVRYDKPEKGFVYLGEFDGFSIYVRDSIYPYYKDKKVGITALERVDDSFSAETELGFKLSLFYDAEPNTDRLDA